MDDGSGDADAQCLRRLIGGLIYLVHTRPDIAFSVRMMSRYMSKPSKHHQGVAKRILRYVASTLDYGLWYESVSNFSLIGYSDSDWAGCMEERRSTSGSIFLLGSSAVT